MEQAEGASAPLGQPWTEGFLQQLGRWRWRIDAAVDRLKNATMHSRPDAPKDYDDSEERTDEVLRILRKLIARPSGGNNTYNEGNGDKRLQSAILTGIILLAVGGISGGVAMYGKLTAIERGINDHDKRLDRLERIDERRYRAGANGAP